MSSRWPCNRSYRTPTRVGCGEACGSVSRPAELFQSDAYDGGEHLYQRSVPRSRDALARPRAATGRAPHSTRSIWRRSSRARPTDATVLLSTDACTKGGKPGARTYKRPSFTDPNRLMNALGGLAHKGPKPEIDDELPRADVIAFLRARAETAPDEDARALYRRSKEPSPSARCPKRALSRYRICGKSRVRLESGAFDGAREAIDEVEHRHGRTPGTTYLRARVALALRLEPPKLIAERVSALALSMTSFQELALLAAEAWLEAGDARRAIPYARDLVDSPGISEGLLLRAQRLLARALETGPTKTQTLADSLRPHLSRVVRQRCSPRISRPFSRPYSNRRTSRLGAAATLRTTTRRTRRRSRGERECRQACRRSRGIRSLVLRQRVRTPECPRRSHRRDPRELRRRRRLAASTRPRRSGAQPLSVPPLGGPTSSRTPSRPVSSHPFPVACPRSGMNGEHSPAPVRAKRSASIEGLAAAPRPPLDVGAPPPHCRRRSPSICPVPTVHEPLARDRRAQGSPASRRPRHAGVMMETRPPVGLRSACRTRRPASSAQCHRSPSFEPHWRRHHRCGPPRNPHAEPRRTRPSPRPKPRSPHTTGRHRCVPRPVA